MAKVERRLVSNMDTGVQFLGKESNFHYHAHKLCLLKADAKFNGRERVMPPELREKLNFLPKNVPYYLSRGAC